MRTKQRSVVMPALLLCLSMGMVAAGEETPTAKPAPQEKPAVPAPAVKQTPPVTLAPGTLDTPGNRALAQVVDLGEEKEISLEALIDLCIEKKVQLIIDREILESYERELLLAVEKAPLRELLAIAAKACGLSLQVSDSGLTTLIPDPEQPERTEMTVRRRMFDRMRDMRNRGGRNDRQRPDQMPQRGDRPRRPDNRVDPEPGNANGDPGVF